MCGFRMFLELRELLAMEQFVSSSYFADRKVKIIKPLAQELANAKGFGIGRI